MDETAKLISALASLAWPLVIGVLFLKLFEPIRDIVKSARDRKFTIKVAGNELTMEEVSEQQQALLNDLQQKVSALERAPSATLSAVPSTATEPSSSARILWVDDNPRNNSILIASLEERGVRVDIALTTIDGIAKFKRGNYDAVISDMGRPEGERAGIDLVKSIKALGAPTPVFIYCGTWAARNLREEALAAGATEITASASTLVSRLPLRSEA